MTVFTTAKDSEEYFMGDRITCIADDLDNDEASVVIGFITYKGLSFINGHHYEFSKTSWPSHASFIVDPSTLSLISRKQARR